MQNRDHPGPDFLRKQLNNAAYVSRVVIPNIVRSKLLPLLLLLALQLAHLLVLLLLLLFMSPTLAIMERRACLGRLATVLGSQLLPQCLAPTAAAASL
jgi:hypothetical protein